MTGDLKQSYDSLYDKVKTYEEQNEKDNISEIAEFVAESLKKKKDLGEIQEELEKSDKFNNFTELLTSEEKSKLAKRIVARSADETKSLDHLGFKDRITVIIESLRDKFTSINTKKNAAKIVNVLKSKSEMPNGSLPRNTSIPQCKKELER